MNDWESYAMNFKKKPATKKKKKKTRGGKVVKTFLLNLRVRPELLGQMQGLADEFAEGNLSAWIRRAASTYRPRR